MKKFNSFYIDEFLLEKFINQWISKKMLKTYYTVFRQLLLDTNIIASDLSTYTARNFKKFLWENLIKRNWTSATYNSYRKCFKCYCNYLVTEEYLEENPINKIIKRKEPSQLPKTLTKNQVDELLSSLETAFDKDTFTWYRNIIIVHTYLHTGLRLSELTNLKVNNLKLYDWYLQVVKWKWSKDRIVPVNKILTGILHNYLKARRKEVNYDDGFLFPTIHWNSLKERDMRKIISKLRYCISFHFTWHQLRHTFATELVRNNFDIFNISRILGHTKIDTTKIYLSVDTKKLKQQIDSINLFA